MPPPPEASPRAALPAPLGATESTGAPRDVAPAPVHDAARRRMWLARVLALGADALQWVLLPLFLPGLVSPWDDALDVVFALIFLRLVGWHPVLLPTLVAELIPGVDLFPTWSAAVWFATRGKRPAAPSAPRT